MLSNKITFSDHADKIKDFIDSQGIDIASTLYTELLSFLSKACKYEEEEQRIKPSIIIGSNLLENEFKRITQATIIPLVEDEVEQSHFTKRLKACLPFCNNGWRVFVDISASKITYGIMRNFNGPSGLIIEELLISEDDKREETNLFPFVLIDVISNFEIRLQGIAELCIIDFRLSMESQENNYKELFCKDLLSAYGETSNKIYKAYMKTINLFSQKLHGSICVIIEHDHNLPDSVLKDGIFLKEPIDIYSILAEDLADSSMPQDISAVISSHEKYYAFTGLFLEMLNVDGVTVVDNKGRIRAFNVFVKPEINNNNSLVGGARKRAADYLRNQTLEEYIGVYFQSQDGMSLYERRSVNE